MTASLWRGLLIAAALTPLPANAQPWISGDCTIQNGEKIAVFVTQGEARIAYGTTSPQVAFPKFEGNILTVVHIGNTANFVLSMDVTNGRSFAVMTTDRGRNVEYNAICKINSGR
jgi:hypothetical protein